MPIRATARTDYARRVDAHPVERLPALRTGDLLEERVARDVGRLLDPRRIWRPEVLELDHIHDVLPVVVEAERLVPVLRHDEEAHPHERERPAERSPSLEQQ